MTMNNPGRCIIVVLVLALGACALPGGSGYKDWRSFYYQVATLEPEEIRAHYQAVFEHHQQSPSATSRLQLAYLTLFFPQPQGEAPQSESVEALLKDIADNHELAPIRDLLLRYSQQGKAHASQSVRLKELDQQCKVVATRQDELRRENDALEQKLAVCADQLEALKQIESVMSAPEPGQRSLP